MDGATRMPSTFSSDLEGHRITVAGAAVTTPRPRRAVAGSRRSIDVSRKPAVTEIAVLAGAIHRAALTFHAPRSGS